MGGVTNIDQTRKAEIANAIEQIADKLRMIETLTLLGLKDFIIDEQRAPEDRRDILPKTWQCQVSWSVIVELGAARQEGRRVCVKHAIIAAQAPTATVDRRLSILAEECWIVRGGANHDHRLGYISLTNEAAEVLSK